MKKRQTKTQLECSQGQKIMAYINTISDAYLRK